MKFKILKKGNRFVAYDLIDKKRCYGSINITNGGFVGDTRCLIELNNKFTEYHKNMMFNVNIKGKGSRIDIVNSLKKFISILQNIKQSEEITDKEISLTINLLEP